MTDLPLPSEESAPAPDAAAHAAELHPQQELWSAEVLQEPVSGEISDSDIPASPPSLTRIIEGLLFIGGTPLTAERAAAAVRGLAPAQFTEAIDSLNHEYRRQGRPYVIQSQHQGFALVLRPRFRQVVERLYGQVREARLSPAAIDVLSLVAYRQPVTKQEVDGIRGADSGSLLRQLLRRGLVAIAARAESGHREVCYGTTPRFLELFKLTSLEDLPQTQDLQKL